MKVSKDESKEFLEPQELADIEEERKHIENIFYARFNYFILFFTLFLSIEVAIFLENFYPAKFKLILLMILSFFGFTISLFIYIALRKIRKALEVTLKYRDCNSVTAQLIRQELGERNKYWYSKYLFSANYILSSTIPVLCIVFMLMIFVTLSYCLLWDMELFSFINPANNLPCPCR